MAMQDTIPTRPIAAAGWRARLGPRAQIAAGAVLLLAVGVFGGNAYLSQQYGPEGAVRHYFAALQSGDAAGAYSDLEVGGPSTPTDAKLLDAKAMAAALRTAHPAFTGVDVGRATVSGTVALLTASYQGPGGRRQLSLTLQRANGERQFGVYPRWRIAVLPAVLKIVVPVGASGVQLDGAPVALAGGRTSNVAVLPMAHRVTLPATPLLEGQSVAVDATLANPDGWGVSFAPKLTAAGQAKATTALKDVFSTCAASTSSAPSGCPQSYNSQSTIQWQLIGDPVAGLTFGTDKNGQPTASGHYLFTYAASSSGRAAVHGIAGSGYLAQLSVTASELRVAGIADDNTVAAAARPAPAIDQAAKDLVQKAFAACVSAADAAPVDCPQANVSAVNTSKNVRWALDGDPLAAATTTWDGNLGALLVKGTFSMSVEYDSTYPSGGHYRNRSDTTRYTAGLIVDAGTLRLVGIRGDF